MSFARGILSQVRMAHERAAVTMRAYHNTRIACLKLNDTAPNFTAPCWNVPGDKIDLYQWQGNSWAMIVSHPADFTPVCTTELAELAKLAPEFEKRGVKILGHSVDKVAKHAKWSKDIAEYGNLKSIPYPIVADADRSVAKQYDMIDDTNIDPEEKLPLTVRSVHLIDPKHKLRLGLNYPASTGRFWPEVLRAIDSILLAEKHPIATPHGWQPGGEVVVKPSISTEDAKKMFPKINVVKPYLRLIPQPK